MDTAVPSLDLLLRHMDQCFLLNYEETVVLPRPEAICEATRRLLRDRDVRIRPNKTEHSDDATRRPQITKALAAEYTLRKDKAQNLLKKKFYEVRVHGRDLLKFKDSANYPYLRNPALCAAPDA